MDLPIAPLAKPFEFRGSDIPVLQVIMIHGFTASPTEVKPLGQYLFAQSSEKWLIRSILLPGHGIDGDQGFKALDHVSFEDWKTHCFSELSNFVLKDSCPIFLVGLSMGALLVIEILLNEPSIKGKVQGGVLLSPAFFIKGKLFPLVKYLKFLVRYQAKSHSSEEFFETYNLFSYKIRSLQGVDQFRKLRNETEQMLDSVSIPLLVFLSENDDLVDILKTKKVLEKKKNVIIEMNSNLGHILTVYPESKQIFNRIYTWIENLLNV